MDPSCSQRSRSMPCSNPVYPYKTSHLRVRVGDDPQADPPHGADYPFYQSKGLPRWPVVTQQILQIRCDPETPLPRQTRHIPPPPSPCSAHLTASESGPMALLLRNCILHTT
ncbi:hypothetical protein LX36DRAFT_348958 [Colletotrichum falcatum]|nr:hypothetical protein LX36DRAFT_348958 [Colletotrichum falcatum]